MNEILCIGGPYDKQLYCPEINTYITDEVRAGYYQYQSQWAKQSIIWIWKDLIGEE